MNNKLFKYMFVQIQYVTFEVVQSLNVIFALPLSSLNLKTWCLEWYAMGVRYGDIHSEKL